MNERERRFIMRRMWVIPYMVATITGFLLDINGVSIPFVYFMLGTSGAFFSLLIRGI